MGNLKYQTITWSSAADGTASATGAALTGTLSALAINIGTSASATLNVTVAMSNALNPQTLMAKAVTASAFFYPAAQSVDASGSAISGVYKAPDLMGDPVLTISGAGSAKTGSATVFWRE